MIQLKQIMTHYVIKSVNLHSGSITNSLFYYSLIEVIIMTTFTINGKDYTHKELNLMWDFFTQDQWDHIISDIQDPEIASTIQELWRASY